MVTGMMGSDDEEEGEGEGAGKEEEKKQEDTKEEKDSEDEDEEKDEDDPKKTFAEKYVGPPGSIVTIQSIPQPPFGIPTMNPQPGPSLCIRNTGDSNKPDVRNEYTYTCM